MPRPDRPLALITGASRGIGSSIAAKLAPTHDLILLARSSEQLAAVAQRLGTKVQTYSVDLGDPAARQALITKMLRETPEVSVLVNNAGIAPSAPVHRTDDPSWAQTVELNLTAPFELIRAFVPGMRKMGWGRIINIASTAALKGYKFTAAYSASKGGLVALTSALAVELAASGITVNAICPGFTDTDIAADATATIQSKTGRSATEARASLEAFSPQGRLVQPDEVGALAAYLASPNAAALSGAALPIDGGETA